MTTMNISLPDSLRRFIDKQVAEGGYGSTSEYVRELIRRDQDRRRLREALLEGATSAPAVTADVAWFRALRDGLEESEGG
jgi:antitoxin ParD1/3/4